MKPARRGRLALTTLSVLFLGGGVFWFAAHNLGAADQIASVASFVVGLTGLVWTTRQARTEPATSTRNVYITNSTGISTGDRTKNTVYIGQRPSLWQRLTRH